MILNECQETSNYDMSAERDSSMKMSRSGLTRYESKICVMVMYSPVACSHLWSRTCEWKLADLYSLCHSRGGW